MHIWLFVCNPPDDCTGIAHWCKSMMGFNVMMDTSGCVSNLPASKGDREATSPEHVPLIWNITEDMVFSAFPVLCGREEVF